MSVALRPSSSMVVAEWVRTIPELLSVPVGVASELPAFASWSSTGLFVRVMVVGGDVNPYLPMGHPVCQIDVFAQKPNADTPPWSAGQNVVGAILEAVRGVALIPPRAGARVLTLAVRGRSYGQARVLEAGGGVLTEPRKLYDDVASRAHWQFDCDFHWSAV